jgi:hypothetical protein
VAPALVGKRRRGKGIGDGRRGRRSKSTGGGDSVPYLVGLPRERVGDEAGAVLCVKGERKSTGQAVGSGEV